MTDGSPTVETPTATRKPRRLIALGIMALPLLIVIGLGLALIQSNQTQVTSGPAPDFTLTLFDGSVLRLEQLRGKVVFLNIWATWCVPCRKEMPALDRLQVAIDKSQLLVLPLSIDRKGVPVVKQFYQELGLRALGIYVDQSGKASSELGAVGLPTTLLIDRDGREIGRKIGPAEWDSPEMIALIREHLGLPASEHKAGP